MQIVNREILKKGETVKFIMNDDGIAFFPLTQQHKDMKIAGLSYEDDYLGNALAGILSSTTVEIRYHKRFSDEHVRNIWLRAAALLASSTISGAKLYYQGRVLKPG